MPLSLVAAAVAAEGQSTAAITHHNSEAPSDLWLAAEVDAAVQAPHARHLVRARERPHAPGQAAAGRGRLSSSGRGPSAGPCERIAWNVDGSKLEEEEDWRRDRRGRRS